MTIAFAKRLFLAHVIADLTALFAWANVALRTHPPTGEAVP